MKKTELLNLWDKMFKSERVEKSFEKMIFALPGNGWRRLILKTKGVYIKVTLESFPSGYWISSEKHRFDLGKDKKWEKMCVAFDKRGTLEDVSIERLNELLKK